MIKNFLEKLFKPNGISVLISAQNEEYTIRLCVESFLDFADEIIIVTNGTTDQTKNISLDLEKKYPLKVKYFDQPYLPDLYHNRAYAFSKAKYRWIFRGDADFIAYTNEDGEKSISNLRTKVLNTLPIYPILFELKFVNLSYKFNLCRKNKKQYAKRLTSFATPLGSNANARIYLNSPFLKFKRLGRWEGIPYMRLYIKRLVSEPYFFHCTIKSDRDLFFRTERTNWRERGDFKTYPTLIDYIEKKVLKEENITLDLAIKNYINDAVLPTLTEYDEKKYFPYPKSIKRVIENEKED